MRVFGVEAAAGSFGAITGASILPSMTSSSLTCRRPPCPHCGKRRAPKCGRGRCCSASFSCFLVLRLFLFVFFFCVGWLCMAGACKPFLSPQGAFLLLPLRRRPASPLDELFSSFRLPCRNPEESGFQSAVPAFACGRQLLDCCLS